MGLKRETLNLSIINAVSILLGLIFHILLGRRFGISWELDCLFVSLLIFSFFGLFNNLLTSLLIPVFNEIKARDEKEGFEFADVIFKWSLFIGLVVCLIVLNASPLIVRFFASGFDERAIGLSTEILKVLFIGYIFYNLSGSISTILNALHIFLMPVLVGLLNPILSIGAIFILTPQYGVKGIAIGYLVSNLLQSVVLMPYLFFKTRWRPTSKVYHGRLAELLGQSSRTVLGGLIWSLCDIISRNIASRLGVGTIALLTYAEKIISILAQVVISPISSVFYSKVSEWIVITRWDEVKGLLTRVMRVNIALAIFVSAGVIVFLKPTLSILFAGSRFTGNDISALFYLMLIELLYFIVLSFEALFVKIAYANRDVNRVLVITTIGVILFYVFAKWLSSLFGVYGLVLSIPLVHIPVSILYFHSINRHLHTSLGELIYPPMRGLILAGVFVIIGLVGTSSLQKEISILFLWGPIWLSLYLVASRYVLDEEWKILMSKEV